MEASCSSGDEALVADTTVEGGEVASISTDASTGDIKNVYDDLFLPGDDVDLTDGGTPDDRIYDINYTGGDGRNVVVQVVTENDVGDKECLYTGFAIG